MRLEQGLLLLCEFVEDCEHVALSTRVLHLLGDKGPVCPQPTQFIRYMYVQQQPLRLGGIHRVVCTRLRTELTCLSTTKNYRVMRFHGVLQVQPHRA